MESFKTKTAQEVSDWLHSEGLSLEICEIFEDLYCYMLAVANDLSAVMLHLYYHTQELGPRFGSIDYYRMLVCTERFSARFRQLSRSPRLVNLPIRDFMLDQTVQSNREATFGSVSVWYLS